MTNTTLNRMIFSNRILAITGIIVTVTSIIITLFIYFSPSKEEKIPLGYEQTVSGGDMTKITIQGVQESDINNVGNVYNGDFVAGDKVDGDKVIYQ